MATKRRMTDSYQELLMNKVIRLTDTEELPEDVILATTVVSENINCQLTYDSIMEQFAINIEKKTTWSATRITMSDVDSVAVMKKLPNAILVAKKYLERSGGTASNVDIPILCVKEGEEDECRPMIFVKGDKYKHGNIKIDIRKCANTRERIVYTKYGVRVSLEEAEEICSVINNYMMLIETSVNQTRDIILMAEVFLIIKKIKEIQGENECEGCRIEHPSQKRHMQLDGCLRDWADVVNTYWHHACEMVEPMQVLRLAEAAVVRVDGVHAMMKSNASAIKDVSSDEKRERVMQRESLIDNPIFNACETAYEQQ